MRRPALCLSRRSARDGLLHHSGTCTQTVTVGQPLRRAFVARPIFAIYVQQLHRRQMGRAAVLDNAAAGCKRPVFTFRFDFGVGTTGFHAPRPMPAENVGTVRFKVRVVGEQLVYATNQLGSADCFRKTLMEDARKAKRVIWCRFPAWKTFDSPRRRPRFGVSSIS